jgi:hypothetical protein
MYFRTAAALTFALVSTPFPLAAADESARHPLTGEWGVLIIQRARGCEWTGVIELVERSGRLSGRGSATPSPGSRHCPRLEGKVNGDVQGDVVRFGFGTGPLGRADFQGRITPGANDMNGTWSTRSAAGEWSAAR